MSDWIEKCVDGWASEVYDDPPLLIDLKDRLRAVHAAHCEALNDPHSALVECKRIVEEQAQRQIEDMRSRLTVEVEVNRQLREEMGGAR